jgi:hypothetical protein
MTKIYLYKPTKANYSYAVIAKNRAIASQYLRMVVHPSVKSWEYLGIDKRTPKQQYEASGVIAVHVPSDWSPPQVEAERTPTEKLGDAKRRIEMLVASLQAANQENRVLRAENEELAAQLKELT